MKIIINCSNLKLGGGMQVAHSFLEEIKYNVEHQFLVVLSEKIAPQIQIASFSPNFNFIVYSISPNSYKAFFGKDNYLDKLEMKFKPDVVFSVFGPTYWKPKVRHICGFAKPGYIYKESPFFKQIGLLNKIKLILMEVVHLYDFRNNNSLLITENEDVSERLRKKVLQKVETISNTFNQVFLDKKKWDLNLNVDTENIDFKILNISANHEHKNLAIIKNVIPILKSKYPDLRFKFYLSITTNELKIESDDVLNENIHFMGELSINQCPYLYAQCDCLFLPTLLECFSASYCEAMYMDVPIITSDLGFARGICANAALYINPLDPNDIAEILYKLSKDKKLQKQLVENGRKIINTIETPKSRAEKYLKILTTLQ